jgi:hypothetical protein
MLGGIVEGFDGAADDRGKVRAAPSCLQKKIVRPREQPALDGVLRVLSGWQVAQALRDDGSDGREGVLDAVVQFLEDQLLQLVGRLAFPGVDAGRGEQGLCTDLGLREQKPQADVFCRQIGQEWCCAGCGTWVGTEIRIRYRRSYHHELNTALIFRRWIPPKSSIPALFGVKTLGTSPQQDKRLPASGSVLVWDFMPTLPLDGRCVALAGEKFVKLDGIPEHQCSMGRLGALLSRRHPASLVEGDNRPRLQVPGKRRTGFFDWRRRILRFRHATLDHHWITIAAATSSTRKIGINTGGTSHSRGLNAGDLDI